jgi:RES domain-containing protein
MRFEGQLYRALNPIWAAKPLSGDGAKLHGGRFNPRGRAALYTSLSVITAIREANQIGTLQPTMLVAYEADLEPVFDSTKTGILDAYGITAEVLAAPDWRSRMETETLSPSQRFAERLIREGFAGMIVPSYARGATVADRNMVLWKWGRKRPARLNLIDDEKRLG